MRMVVLYILSVLLVWLVGTVSFSLMHTMGYRYQRKKKLLKEHFCCDFCGTQLRAIETVPVFSFCALRGRCRYCGEPLSRREVWNEVAGGLLALLLFFRFGNEDTVTGTFHLSGVLDIVVHFNLLRLVTLLVLLAFFCLMDLVLLVDWDTMEIPNYFVILVLFTAVASLFALPSVSIAEHLIGGICVSLPMLLLMLAVPGSFGGGDMKLSAAVGLFLGWKLTVVGFLLGLLSGGIYGIYLLLSKKKGKKDHFSFGPFLCTGYMLAVLCGMDVIAGYMQLFHLIRG